ncbi:uncharacterized protein PSFLO_03196 [Pseudozyma flocculosa]|uniref:Coronin n=1 Tax=Pseudozyma flocculosa TaxID=84751 RepID=A0A5C3F0W7_9BASI|nr:uncharacterized protein PSFLO_03196 [Pseudozyma flocculosa]
MPPSRFANVSKWRNALLTPAKQQHRFHELGLATPPDSGTLVAASSDWIIARANTTGTLLFLPHHSPGKYAKQPPTYHAASAPISDLALSHFDDGLLAVASENGAIALHTLPPPPTADAAFPPALDPPPQRLIDLEPVAATKPVSSLAFHTTTSNLLAASAHSSVALYDVNAAKPTITFDAPSPLLSLDWSQDGVNLASIAKDGVVSIWDPRSSSQPASTVHAHASKVKPSRLAYVRSNLITTGFSAMREREWAVWDPRALQSPLKRATIDNSTGVITPLVDHDRGLVYLLVKGDATLRWLEVDDAKTFTEGNCPLNFTMGGGAIAPPTVHRVMEGEVDRLVLASTTSDDCLVPVSVTIPRRQYIDFHPDLYPPTSSRVAAQTAASWLAGSDAAVELISQDPAHAATERQRPPTQAGQPGQDELPAAAQTIAPSSSSEPKPVTTPSASAASKRPSEPQTPQPVQKTSAAPLPTPKRVAQPPTAPSKDAPRWSRRFLLGSTPLIAAHQNLAGLDLGMPPDGRMLAANDRFLLFPLAGPGGRIGVHPTKESGRMPTLVPALSASSKLVDFALDPLDPQRAVSVHEDAAIRVWRLPANGEALAEQTIDTPEAILSSKRASKQSELAFHPSAKDLLASCSPEKGGSLLLWNLASPSTGPVAIPVEGDGTTSLAWSPDGRSMALSCKDKAVRVIALRPSATRAADSAPMSTASSDAERASRAFLERSITFARHEGRPHVTLTFAQSSDGKIAGEGKQQLALSGKESMLMTHNLRTLHDGILVGIGTVLNDDPQLNARLLSSPTPVDRLPRPIVLDSALRTPVACKLIRNGQSGVGRRPLILCSASADEERRRALHEAGAEVVQLPSAGGSQLAWDDALALLSRHGIERLMVEGGAAVIDSLMGRQDLVDTLLVTVAPRTVGEHGFGFSAAVPHPCPGASQRESDTFRLRAEETFGPDRVIVWDQSSRKPEVVGDGSATAVDINTTAATLRFSDLRNCRLTWIDDEHLAVVGHTVGSARQLRLLRVGGSGLEEKSRLTLDVSPALLFPSYDADTNILWLWSKGERLISAYEVRVADRGPLTALSTFQHGQPQLGVAFLAKTAVDPSKVEIGVSYRIEKGEIRRVSWSVPRLRPEFFQDDIFIPTRDTSQPLTTAARWLQGESDEREATYLDLRPADMVPLSQAPEVKKESKLPKGPVAKVLTEDEKKEKLLDGIFKKAKHRGGTAYDAAGAGNGVGRDEEEDDDDDDDEPPVGSAARRAPDNDDWSD